MFPLSDVDAESANRKFSHEQIMVFLALLNESKPGTFQQRGWKPIKSHMRGSSDSCAIALPCDSVWSYGQDLSHSPSVMVI